MSDARGKLAQRGELLRLNQPVLRGTQVFQRCRQFPRAGFNTLEQGAGELNVEGAVRLAKLVRGDLSSWTQLGAPLLTSAPPAPRTTIAGQAFAWSQGLVLKHSVARRL